MNLNTRHKKRKLILLIIDGWGITKNTSNSATFQAKTPFIDSLLKKYPFSELSASGIEVGLPKNIVGNSEVGHINIGAGRIVNQSLKKINNSINKKEFDKNKILLEAFSYAKNNNKAIHLMGLVSDGGIHSHIDHIKTITSIAKKHDINKLYIHAFTDGRDTDPKSSIKYLSELEDHFKNTTGKLASIIGRYYAMDRDKRWERIKIAYDSLVNGIATKTDDWKLMILKSYENKITDEFIKPIIIKHNQCEFPKIEEQDVVICTNFRTDRSRQITEVLTQKPYLNQNMNPLDLFYITFTNYDKNFKKVKVLFKNQILKNTIGEILSKNKKTQLRIAETEKYPHITYFFSGGREDSFNLETRILCPSPKVPTYDLKPEMNIKEINKNAISNINKREFDFICINYANADMVGHSGNFSATIKACEFIDKNLKELVECAQKNEYSTLIISDHGNAEEMINKIGGPQTAHTKNKVPCIFISDDSNLKLKDGILADIAPTILTYMNIKAPKEMTGESLFN